MEYEKGENMMFYIQGSLALQNFIIFIFIPRAYLQGCDGNRGCCSGSQWNETLNKCLPCMDGYTGLNCNKTCLYPKYGFRCQQNCTTCDRTSCNFSTGCPFPLINNIGANETDFNGTTRRRSTTTTGSTTKFMKGEKSLKNNIVSLSALAASSSLIFVAIIYAVCSVLKSKGLNIFRQPREETQDISHPIENHYCEIKEMSMLTQIDIKA